MVSCSDVCELVQEMLNGLGFTFDDNEASHEDMIQALQQCTLVRDSEYRKPKKVYIHVRGGVAYEGRVPKGVEVIIKDHD
ncbi:MAG: hypothetical protein ABIH46_07125 [Chloroflexota bacterium]